MKFTIPYGIVKNDDRQMFFGISLVKYGGKNETYFDGTHILYYWLKIFLFNKTLAICIDFSGRPMKKGE